MEGSGFEFHCRLACYDFLSKCWVSNIILNTYHHYFHPIPSDPILYPFSVIEEAIAASSKLGEWHTHPLYFLSHANHNKNSLCFWNYSENNLHHTRLGSIAIAAATKYLILSSDSSSSNLIHLFYSQGQTCGVQKCINELVKRNMHF